MNNCIQNAASCQPAAELNKLIYIYEKHVNKVYLSHYGEHIGAQEWIEQQFGTNGTCDYCQPIFCLKVTFAQDLLTG